MRKGIEYGHDSVALTPVQVIIAGVVSALVFIFSILLLVYFVTR